MLDLEQPHKAIDSIKCMGYTLHTACMRGHSAFLFCLRALNNDTR